MGKLVDFWLKLRLFRLNSIFFQREVYPSSDFIMEKKHGLSVWLCQDEELKNYLKTVLDQMRVWIEVILFFRHFQNSELGGQLDRSDLGADKC